MRAMTPGEEHIWNWKSQQSKKKVLDMSWLRCSWGIRVEVSGNQFSYMNLQFTTDWSWKYKSRNLEIRREYMKLWEWMSSPRERRRRWEKSQRTPTWRGVIKGDRSRSKGVKEEIVMFQRLRKEKVSGRKECWVLRRFQIRCWLKTVHWICNKVVIDHLIKGNSKGASWIEWVEEWMVGEHV